MPLSMLTDRARRPGGPVPLFAGEPATQGIGVVPQDNYPLALLPVGPELTTEGAKDHADYNRSLQQTLQNYAGDTRLVIAPIRIQPYPDWCVSRTGTRPTRRLRGHLGPTRRPVADRLATGPEPAVLVRLGPQVQAVLRVRQLVTGAQLPGSRGQNQP